MADYETVEKYGGFVYWRLAVEVQGISEMLMHSPNAMKPAEKGVRGKRIPTPEVEAEQGAYRNPEGGLYVPAVAFRNCLLNACTKGDFKVGKKGLVHLLSGALQIEQRQLPLYRDGLPITDYSIDLQRVVVQKAGVVRARPRIELEWSLYPTLLVDTALYKSEDDLEQLLSLMRFAGQFVGLLDYRPEKKGEYGKFTAAIVDSD